MERRKSERVRCKLPCEIQRGRSEAVGTVLDMSEGGLSIQTGVEAGQGDVLRVRVKAASSTLDVEGLVWHSRRVRRRSSAETTWILGLMISEAPDAYFALVPRTSARPRPQEASGAGAPDQAAPDEAASEEAALEEAAPHEASPEEPDDLLAFRIRVKQCSGPRTRVLSLNAESEDEARSFAIADLEGDWEVLEVWAP